MGTHLIVGTMDLDPTLALFLFGVVLFLLAVTTGISGTYKDKTTGLRLVDRPLFRWLCVIAAFVCVYPLGQRVYRASVVPNAPAIQDQIKELASALDRTAMATCDNTALIASAGKHSTGGGHLVDAKRSAMIALQRAHKVAMDLGVSDTEYEIQQDPTLNRKAAPGAPIDINDHDLTEWKSQ